MTLEGKVVLITGASRGLGHALAVSFAREGASVVAAARTLRPQSGDAEGSLEETVQRVKDAGGKAIAVPCDVTNESDVRGLVERTLAEVGPIDVLISNAGVHLNYGTMITDIDVARWDGEMAVNVRGPLLACKYILPGMMARRRGCIVIITSHSAIETRAGRLAYGPSKAALERLTLNLAMDMRPYDIAVNGLRPGPFYSAMNKERAAPSGARVYVTAEDVVPSVLWLAQQTASTCSGRIVNRDEFGKTWP